jgi:hypothetical protein
MLLRTSEPPRSTHYTRHDLDREARGAIKTLGRFRRWELVIFGNGHVQLVVHYVPRSRLVNCVNGEATFRISI